MSDNVHYRLIGICENGEDKRVIVPDITLFVMGTKDESVLEKTRQELKAFYGKFGWDLDGDVIFCYMG